MERTLTPLAPQAFAQAKAQLSELMDQAVHRHRLQLIDRHRGKEQAVLVSVADLELLLEGFRFQPKVSVSDGEFVVRVPELNLVAGGDSYEDAVEELVELAEQQAAEFLDRLDFYLQTERRGQLAWLLKVALTPPEERSRLFRAPAPAPEAEAARSA
ncbi:MAG: type II toxin-antitoxin system prevent-host-death family antitoxin [Actinobacteria bacterium]|nr:type II toxin-antitoxin system prevent-host-death family antitoxin [Actinomycetota bacterium]